MSSNRKLNEYAATEAAVVADMPSMDVESSPPVATVTTTFRKTVAHDNGGVLYFSAQPSTRTPADLHSRGGTMPDGLRAFELHHPFS
jgi:hypothetical protein